MRSLPLLEKAVRDLDVDDEEQPLVIADYGSSQGKNSMAPMRVAIKALRERVGPDRPIVVFHIDQPANDFNTLFQVLDTDPDRYVLDEPNVFPCAIGRSFYESMFPREYIHLGWSSYAAVWLSRIPTLIQDHFIVLRSSGAERAAFEQQAAHDWEAFLSLRARELQPGGRLMIVLPGQNDDGGAGFEFLFDIANDVLKEMVLVGEIRSDERKRMVLGTYPRRKCELLAPFQADSQFRGLRVEHYDFASLPDPAWSDYERDGDLEALATKHARLFRSIFVPSLTLSLTAAHDAEQRHIFAEHFEQRLKQNLSNRPRPLHSFVQTLVVAKESSCRTWTAEPREMIKQVGTNPD